MNSIKNRPYLMLVLAVLFWAGNFILGRAFHGEIPPVALAFWRWLGAALLVTMPALRYLRRDRQALLKSWPILLLLSTLGIAAFNTLAYTGLQYTEAINAFLMQSLMPVLIVLLSFVLFREKITTLQGLGILVSLCGAVTIIARGDIDLLLSLSINRGDLLVFVAIVCYAGYSVMLRKRPNVHPLAFLAVTFWLGSLILLPLYLWETLTIASLELKPSILLVIAYVAIFPSIISYLCYNRSIELIGANRAGLFIHLMPVFGSLMAMLFLDESFRWFHSLGILLIGMGIYLTARKRRA
jgi:drug/metabolite transporter (DMT)-like permease